MDNIVEFMSLGTVLATLWSLLVVTIAIMIACIIINEKKKEKINDNNN